MVTAEWATVRMKWRDISTGLSYSLGCKKHSASVCSIKETKTESCPIDAYSSFLINSSDQHPSFILRCLVALTDVRGHCWECPGQTWPWCRQKRGVRPLTLAWLTRSLNRPLEQGHSLNACLSRAGQACLRGVWRSGCTHGKVTSRTFPGSPPSVSRTFFHSSSGLSLNKAWLTHRGTHGWNSLRVCERGFRALFSLSRFLKLLNEALNSKQQSKF